MSHRSHRSHAPTLARHHFIRSLSVFGLGALAVACAAAPDGELAATTSQGISYSPLPPTSVSALGAADLANLYNIPTFLQPGATLAYITPEGDDPNAEEDLAVYRSAYGLPTCTAATNCLAKITETGATTGLPAATTNAGEDMADALDMASAGCPTCKLLVVEMNPSDAPTALATAIATAKGHGASAIVVLSSWETGYVTLPPDTTFTQPGITVFSSPAWSGFGDYPASSPSVVSVGLTNPTMSTTSYQNSETASSILPASCTTWPKPSWQHDTSCAGRTMFDVSATGGPVWTFNTYGANNGTPGWIAAGGADGSVLASSLVAGIFAQSGHGGAGPAFPYANLADFNDVTSGTDGSCAGILCNAGPGYDGPTGLGTPDGFNLAQINREQLDFSTSDIDLEQPTIGSQGTLLVQLEPGQTYINSIDTYTTWASYEGLGISFANVPTGVTAGPYAVAVGSLTEPAANFILTATQEATIGQQATVVVSGTAGGVTHSMTFELQIVAPPPCIPTQLSCNAGQCGSIVNNCGTVIYCDSNACGSDETCSNQICCPTGEAATGGTCCPPGEVGGGGHCCASGSAWNGMECSPVIHVPTPPPPHCGGGGRLCQ